MRSSQRNVQSQARVCVQCGRVAGTVWQQVKESAPGVKLHRLLLRCCHSVLTKQIPLSSLVRSCSASIVGAQKWFMPNVVFCMSANRDPSLIPNLLPEFLDFKLCGRTILLLRGGSLALSAEPSRIFCLSMRILDVHVVCRWSG